MKNLFLTQDISLSAGVAYKNYNLKKEVLSLFAEKGNITIAELCNFIGLSTPKVTSLVNELIDIGLVSDYGKDDSKGGRPPNIYGLKPDSIYFVGVDVRHEYINFAITDFRENLVEHCKKIPFDLENTEESLSHLCTIVEECIAKSKIDKDRIQGIGINLSGRVNFRTGYSYSYYHFQEDPLSQLLEKRIGIPVFLENDSRAMTYGEYYVGAVKDEKNVLFINLDYGIGMGIVIDGELYYGKSGYSGEFGHIPLFDNKILCQCGKQGCLETEASGWALVKKFTDKIKAGQSSILVKSKEDLEKITIDNIIAAALNDDVLAIETIAEIGDNIGRGIATLINIFNPELIILGGRLSRTGDYIRLPIKSAINKLSISLMNNDTKLIVSDINHLSGVIGACLLVRKKLLSTS